MTGRQREEPKGALGMLTPASDALHRRRVVILASEGGYREIERRRWYIGVGLIHLQICSNDWQPHVNECVLAEDLGRYSTERNDVFQQTAVWPGMDNRSAWPEMRRPTSRYKQMPQPYLTSLVQGSRHLEGHESAKAVAEENDIALH